MSLLLDLLRRGIQRDQGSSTRSLVKNMVDDRNNAVITSLWYYVVSDYSSIAS